MNAPSRSSNASGRVKRPQRPLPAPPSDHEAKGKLPQLSHLIKEDIHEPFQLLESHPLNLICQFHNVKRVSLEEGVPPPFKFDVPVLRGAMESSGVLLPTHVLAVYDQDSGSEQSESSLTLSPHTADLISGRPSLPGTALLIPVNSDLWESHFTTTFTSEPLHLSSPSPPAIDAMRRHSRSGSITSGSSSRNSPARSRPRSVLSLPVHVVRVPSAKALPLLLLSCLRILPYNHVLPALLPRKVLAELPAPPTILAQHLLDWLYPISEERGRRSLDSLASYSRHFERRGNASLSIPRSPRLPLSPLLSPTFTPSSDAMKRFSSASVSSLSVGSSISSLPSLRTPEPICALTDSATRDDPDLCLLALAQQNFGIWTDALALGVRDQAVVRLAELAWSVASEARRVRFGVGEHFFSLSEAGPYEFIEGLEGHRPHNSLHTRQARSRGRAPTPFADGQY